MTTPPKHCRVSSRCAASATARWALVFMLSTAAFRLHADPVSQTSTNRAGVLILVQGASGLESYGALFQEWTDDWNRSALSNHVEVIRIGGNTPPASSEGSAVHDQLKAAIDRQEKQSPTPLWIVMIGHGTFDGRQAKFNLDGPDVTAEEMAQWLQSFQRPLIFINCASASAPFLGTLSGPDRVVITATKSGYEQNFARFGQFLAQDIANPEADLDKDGQTSVLEGFLAASHDLASYYSEAGILASEHAMIDDNGDRLGTPADWFRGVRAVKKPSQGASTDGLRARQLCLAPSQEEKDLPPEVRAERDRLEIEIAHLRERKTQIPLDEYYKQLETLLVQLAGVYQLTPAAEP